MSAAKRRHQRNVRGAFVMGISLDEYLQRLLAGALWFHLTEKRIFRILSAHGGAS